MQFTIPTELSLFFDVVTTNFMPKRGYSILFRTKNTLLFTDYLNLYFKFEMILFYRLGGVSIGSLIGALWAVHRDFEKMKKLAEEWFEMIHYDYLGHASNLTYPYISVFTGDYFNTTVKRTLGKFVQLYIKF